MNAARRKNGTTPETRQSQQKESQVADSEVRTIPALGEDVQTNVLTVNHNSLVWIAASTADDLKLN